MFYKTRFPSYLQTHLITIYGGKSPKAAFLWRFLDNSDACTMKFVKCYTKMRNRLFWWNLGTYCYPKTPSTKADWLDLGNAEEDIRLRPLRECYWSRSLKQIFLPLLGTISVYRQKFRKNKLWQKVEDDSNIQSTNLSYDFLVFLNFYHQFLPLLHGMRYVSTYEQKEGQTWILFLSQQFMLYFFFPRYSVLREM